MPTKKKVYIASPIGFSYHGDYADRIKARVKELGLEPVDPWDMEVPMHLKNPDMSHAWWIGNQNRLAIQKADYLLGVLDGTQVDDGTASEIGFAAAIGMPCFGLRTDFRKVGDHGDVLINLQVQYWIEWSGGQIFRKIEDIDLKVKIIRHKARDNRNAKRFLNHVK